MAEEFRGGNRDGSCPFDFRWIEVKFDASFDLATWYEVASCLPRVNADLGKLFPPTPFQYVADGNLVF